MREKFANSLTLTSRLLAWPGARAGDDGSVLPLYKGEKHHAIEREELFVHACSRLDELGSRETCGAHDFLQCVQGRNHADRGSR